MKSEPETAQLAWRAGQRLGTFTPAQAEECHDLPGWAGAGQCEIRWGQQVTKLAMNASLATDLPTLQSVAPKPQGGDEGTERPPRPKRVSLLPSTADSDF